MNLYSTLKLPSSHLEIITKSNLNRLRNSSFEDSVSSFFPWFPSGCVKLETEEKGAFLGKNHVVFSPGENQIGRISQRTRTLQVGRLYILNLAACSTATMPKEMIIQFGGRMVVVEGDLFSAEYHQYSFAFRARCRRPRLRITLLGSTEGTKVAIDSVTLRAI